MPTLYRTYRPQTFADITGQEPVVKTVANEVALGRVAHAYLLSGPRGVGKTTLARVLAKAINCERRKPDEAEPCGQCPNCLDIASGRHLDVIEIDAASHTGVDNVRENIIENAQFHPSRGRYKVFIIDEVHMLSVNAFNALLKTLEEPPAHVIFVLATTEPHKLPATVVSRCERYTFKRIPYDAMLARLKTIAAAEKIKVDKEVLQRIINKSDGCLRDAESLLGQLFSLNLKHLTLADVALWLPTANAEELTSYLEHLVGRRSKEALGLLRTLQESGLSFEQFLYDLIELLRAVLTIQATRELPESADYPGEVIKRLRALAGTLPEGTTIRFIEAALKRRLELKTTPFPELPLELLTVELSLLPTGPNASTPPLAETLKVAAPLPPETLAPPPPPDSAPTPEPKPRGLKQSLSAALSSLTGHTAPHTTLQAIQNQWSELVTKITAQNHSLNFILATAHPSAVDNAGLHLSVPYSLHRDKLLEAKNKHLIEENLVSLFGEPMALACEVVSATPPAPDPELTALALEFGGEVVG